MSRLLRFTALLTDAHPTLLAVYSFFRSSLLPNADQGSCHATQDICTVLSKAACQAVAIQYTASAESSASTRLIMAVRQAEASAKLERGMRFDGMDFPLRQTHACLLALRRGGEEDDTHQGGNARSSRRKRLMSIGHVPVNVP